MNGLRFYLRLFLLVVLLTCGCSGQVVTPMPSTTLALLSTANIAPKSPSNTPRPSSSPTLTPVLPTSPAPIEKTKTGQPNLLTLTITPSSTPDFRIWNETADFYKTIAIADRDDEKFVIFQPGGSSQKIFSFDPGPYNPIQASQITTRCALIAVVYTDEGHKIIRLDKNGKSIEEIFSFQQRIPGTAKYLPFLSPDGTMVSYVVFSGEQYRSSAEYQDVEIVKLNQPDLPIRLTAHGRAWDEGGVWSPDGSQIAYTDRDDQGALQVYATKIDDMTQRPLT